MKRAWSLEHIINRSNDTNRLTSAAEPDEDPRAILVSLWGLTTGPVNAVQLVAVFDSDGFSLEFTALSAYYVTTPGPEILESSF